MKMIPIYLAIDNKLQNYMLMMFIQQFNQKEIKKIQNFQKFNI